MSRVEVLKNNCTSGELTPKLHRRSDIEQHSNGLATCENAIVSPYGGVQRRWGLQFAAAAKYNDKICVMRKFEFNEEQAYALEIGEGYIRFFETGQIIHTTDTVTLYNGGITYDEGDYVKDGSDIIYRSRVNNNVGNTPASSPTEWEVTDIVEVTTEYLESELRELRFEQSADVLYIFHKNHNPAKLVRLSQTLWTWGYVSFDGGPFLPENDTLETLTASAVTGSGITVTASADTFAIGHIGSVFSITSGKMSQEVTGSFSGTGQSSSVSTGSEKVEIEISGTWVAATIIERSFDLGTSWFPYRTIVSNMVTILEDTRDVQYRLNCTAYTSGSVVYRLSVLDSESKGYGSFRVTAFGDSKSVTADVIEEIRSTNATRIWRKPAWSSLQGYPRAGKIYEGRMVVTSTDDDPTGVWGSSVLDFDDFTEGTTDDAAFKFTLNAAGGLNVVKWMQAWQQLTLGTAGGEVRLTSSQGISPSNPPDKKQDTDYGSAEIQSVIAARAVVFVDRTTRIVREYVYSDQTKTYDSVSISLLSDHIPNNGLGIVDMGYQEKQLQIIWFVLEDGTLGAVTYQPNQSVMGWHHHTTEGWIDSIVTTPGTEGHDVVWVSVMRRINDQLVRYIEYMNEDEASFLGKLPSPVITSVGV
jgi:hypothetical protein